jgi:hypothetical protein
VYYHIPKTAGTSCKRVLEAWYPNMIRDRDLSPSTPRVNQAGQDLCVAGHFATRLIGHELALLDLAPELLGASPHSVFTILRDPLEHALSAYYHLRDVDKDVVGGLMRFLEYRHPFQLSLALGIPSSEYIAAALDSFSVVGDTSDLQRSLDVLADVIDKPRMEVPSVRVGTRDSQLVSLTAEERSRFEKRWSLEYEIYEAARDRLARRDSFRCGTVDTSFAHVEETRAVVESARQSLNLMRHNVALENANQQQELPELPPELQMLVSKKDERIRELENTLAVSESRHADYKSIIAGLKEKTLSERDFLNAKLQEANNRNAEVVQLAAKHERLCKDQKKVIHQLTKKLDAVEAARADAVRRLEELETLRGTLPHALGIDWTLATRDLIETGNQSPEDWQIAMSSFMRQLNGALSDIRITVDQLDMLPKDTPPPARPVADPSGAKRPPAAAAKTKPTDVN